MKAAFVFERVSFNRGMDPRDSLEIGRRFELDGLSSDLTVTRAIDPSDIPWYLSRIPEESTKEPRGFTGSLNFKRVGEHRNYQLWQLKNQGYRGVWYNEIFYPFD
jgi:hypothetical protein